MPWTTPTLEDVRRQNRDHITAHLHSVPLVPNSVARVIGDGNAGLAYLNLLYLDWLSRQFLPDTAEHEWLQRHADIWLVEGPKPATFANGTVNVSGINGSFVPVGSQLSGNADIAYETLELVTVGTVPAPVKVRAIDPGVAGNLEAGSVLTFVSAIVGIDAQATVVVMHGGTDPETDDELRERVLARIQKPPMGGDADDYVAWALEVPGVTRAWCYPLEMGIGTVTVRFMCDELRADQDGFPTADDVARVEAHLAGKRPVAVKDFFVVAPIRQELSFEIVELALDNEATRAAIEASVKEMLIERAEPGQTIYASWIGEAVSQAVGEDYHTLIFENTPMLSPGHLAVIGSIIYD